MNLIIAGIEISFLQSVELKQKLKRLSNISRHRMMNGDLIKNVAWSKRQTEIRGSGWLPPGLSGVDFNVPVTIDCIKHESISSVSNAIAITDTVRPDKDPWGVAQVNGQWQDVGSTWSGGTLTIDVTPGATQYQARWLPRIVFDCDFTEEETDRQGNVHIWSLVGEEV